MLIKRKSDSSNVFYVSIRECNLSKDFCNIYDTLTTSNEHLSYCERRTIKIPSYPGEDFVKCNKGEFCTYWDGKKRSQQNCACGFNEEGQGYCPLPNGRMKDNWSKRTNYLLELTNNECHTLSRFNCYTKNTLEIKREKARLSSLTLESALFHNAVPCPFGIINSSELYNINLLFLGIILLFII